MEQTNKTLARRFFEEVLNQGNLSAIDELLAPDVVTHAPGIGPPAAGASPLELTGQAVCRLRATWPDIHFTIDDQVAEGDQVVTRWTWCATQKGEIPDSPFGAIPPTGKEVSATGITIHRFVNGQIVEIWRSQDSLGLFFQLGVLPHTRTAAARP